MNDITQSITFLYSDDLDATSRFYQHVMGFPLARDQGSCRIFKIGTVSFLGFCNHLEPAHQKSVIFTLVTDHVDDWFTRLSVQGVKFTKQPSHNQQYGIYHFFVEDPNGYLLEIQKFDEPLK